MDDLDAWEPQEPPRGFAERVVLRATTEGGAAAKRSRAVRVGAVTLALFAAAAAGLLLLPGLRDAPHGDVIARDRVERAISDRALVVLEAGAHVSWRGDDVTQTDGDVFYRVQPGAPFRVHTAAGDVAVKGTCFRVKLRASEESAMNKRDWVAGGVGAVAGAIALVGVYEGKVVVSHAKGAPVYVAAGQSATLDGSGAHAQGDLAEGEKAFETASASPAEGKADDPLLEANQSLVASMKTYKDRLAAIESEKQKLEKQLAEAEHKIAAAQADGAAPPGKNAYDLSKDDWAELAKTGAVKFRLPCEEGNKMPTAGYLDKLGLAPQDGPIIGSATAKSKARVWSFVKPLCVQAVGTGELAEKMGTSTCMHVIIDIARAKDPAGVDEAYRQVGEIRAGIRPAPAEGDAVNPVLSLLLGMTGEMPRYEAELAQSLGPEDAHRVAYADTGCSSTSSFSGPGPRKP